MFTRPFGHLFTRLRYRNFRQWAPDPSPALPGSVATDIENRFVALIDAHDRWLIVTGGGPNGFDLCGDLTTEDHLRVDAATLRAFGAALIAAADHVDHIDHIDHIGYGSQPGGGAA